MTTRHPVKERLRYLFVHVPRVSVDILRTEGVRPLIEKVGRFVRQVFIALGGKAKEPVRKGIERRRVAPGTRADYFKYLTDTTGRGCGYVPIAHPDIPDTDIRLIAFYLPQFHPIHENDEWWGRGFTEWTNVTRAVPQFVGHYQPKLPGELGFYDLRVRDVQRRQVELARQYGLHGFCFHFYWFGGKRLLEMPLLQFLSDKSLDFPFCINWANENWTRRWDGTEENVLMGQSHSPEDDIAFIEYVSKYMRDERYVRVGGKPLLSVYRTALLPEPKETAERWRRWCRENGIGEIFLALTHSFEPVDPRDIGFDAAIEFAPNTFSLKDITHRFDLVNDRFQGKILDYTSALEIARNYRKPPYTKFRSACPSWDNDARRPGRGNTLAGSTPEVYKDWLRLLMDFTVENFPEDERFIFLNAWNEWAEGAYLEPDRHHGYAYLEATAEALASYPKGMAAPPGRWKALFVSHDACRGGAQSVLLDVVSWFREHTYVEPRILCLESGEWLPRFEAAADTCVLSEMRKKAASEEELLKGLVEFCGGKPDLVYGNSVASGREYKLLSKLGAPIITHFHELEMSIKRYASGWADDTVKRSSHIIACSGAVKDNLVKNHGVAESDVTVAYSSIMLDGTIGDPADSERRRIKGKLALRDGKYLVFGCGIGMPFRKGADLFIETARTLRAKGLDNFHFYWVGDFGPAESDERYGRWADYTQRMKKEGLDGCVTFLGVKDNPREYFQAGDVFLLTSREDPFPLVALEAAECGLPVVCFADAGGMPEFVGHDAGFVVPFEDAREMAEKAAALISDKALRRRLGARGREKLLKRFTFEHEAPHILSACRATAGKAPVVSVIVPNYNHAPYLPERLDSIFGQGFKDFEVIILDDCSTDGSMGVIEKYKDRADVRIIRNETNSGSTFRQWLKGIDMARADIIWIAESDDASDPKFLESLLPGFRDPDVRLAYSESHIMDEHGKLHGCYADGEYLASLSETKWKGNYRVTASREISDGLGVKNTLLNVSSALYRKFPMSDEFRNKLQGMKIAGDWYFAVYAILGGKVLYDAGRLNYHRRHSQSVVGKVVSDKRVEDFFREFHEVQSFIFDNYELDREFAGKWEDYLRKQWEAFYPGRPFEEIERYYPFTGMKVIIMRGVPK